MVFFNCSQCGESIKKKKAPVHLQRCFKGVLSCVDCGNEFKGTSYANHFTCITEVQKYEKQGTVVDQYKGDQKQLDWFRLVQKAILSGKGSSKCRELLKRLQDFPNTPRKKMKFLNFVANSIHGFRMDQVEEAWEIISEYSSVQDLITKDNGSKLNIVDNLENDCSKITENVKSDKNECSSITVNGEKHKKRKEKKRLAGMESSESLPNFTLEQNNMQEKECFELLTNGKCDMNECSSITINGDKHKKRKEKKRSLDMECAVALPNLLLEQNNMLEEQCMELFANGKCDKNECSFITMNGETHKKRKHKKNRTDLENEVLPNYMSEQINIQEKDHIQCLDYDKSDINECSSIIVNGENPKKRKEKKLSVGMEGVKAVSLVFSEQNNILEKECIEALENDKFDKNESSSIIVNAEKHRKRKEKKSFSSENVDTLSTLQLQQNDGAKNECFAFPTNGKCDMNECSTIAENDGKHKKRKEKKRSVDMESAEALPNLSLEQNYMPEKQCIELPDNGKCDLNECLSIIVSGDKYKKRKEKKRSVVMESAEALPNLSLEQNSKPEKEYVELLTNGKCDLNGCSSITINKDKHTKRKEKKLYVGMECVEALPNLSLEQNSMLKKEYIELLTNEKCDLNGCSSIIVSGDKHKKRKEKKRSSNTDKLEVFPSSDLINTIKEISQADQVDGDSFNKKKHKSKIIEQLALENFSKQFEDDQSHVANKLKRKKHDITEELKCKKLKKSKCTKNSNDQRSSEQQCL